MFIFWFVLFIAFWPPVRHWKQPTPTITHFRNIIVQLDSETERPKTIDLFRYIKIQLEREVLRTKTKESGWYTTIFHIQSNVFLLFLSSLPRNQAEYLIFRKWPIAMNVKYIRLSSTFLCLLSSKPLFQAVFHISKVAYSIVSNPPNRARKNHPTASFCSLSTFIWTDFCLFAFLRETEDVRYVSKK